MYLGVAALREYIFAIVLCSSWIDPFVIMQCSSLSLVTVFVLKSILSDRSIDTSAFFYISCSIFFHLFHFSLCVPLDLKSVSCKQHICRFCFCICSSSLCIWIRAYCWFKVNYWLSCAYCPFVHFFLVILYFGVFCLFWGLLLLVLSSSVIWLGLCYAWTPFFFVFIFYKFLVFITVKFVFNYICVYIYV